MRLLMMTLAFVAIAFPAPGLAHEGTEISIQGEARPDATIQIEGEEFEPGDEVRIELRRGGASPVELGEVKADSDGAFEVSFHVPATVEPGIYQLAADGEESATTEVTVLEPATGATESELEPDESTVSNNRPAGETIGLAVMIGVFGIAGAGLIWLSRTRAHAGPARGSA